MHFKFLAIQTETVNIVTGKCTSTLMVAHILTSALRGLLNTTVGYSLKHEEREEEASSNFSPR